MFKHTRKSLAGLTAVAALAGSLGANAAAPAVADASPACTQWSMPSTFTIQQTNRWTIYSTKKRSSTSWAVSGYTKGANMRGTMKLSRFDVSGTNAQVRFTITWTNGTGGVYAGTIDDDGFLSGLSTDRFNKRSKASFRFQDTIDCA